MACRRHDGGGGKPNICDVSAPSVAFGATPLAGEDNGNCMPIRPSTPLAKGPDRAQHPCMRMCLLPSLLFLAARTFAQDAPLPVSTEAPTEASTEPATAAEVALKFGAAETRMTVPVSIAGAGPFAFIVDTGAQRTVISRQLAATLGLAAGRTVSVTAMTGTSSVGTVLIPSLSVSPLAARRIEAPALEEYHLGAQGLIGIDTLQDQAVTIDFDAQTMAIAPSRKRRIRDKPDGDAIIVRARSLFGQLIVTDAYCGSQRVRLILDTGSVVSMGNEALRHKVMRKGASLTRIALLSVTGRTLFADYTTIDRIKIGDLTIQNLPIAFADAAPFKQFALESKPAIMLGMDALKLFRRVDIDFANRQVRLALPRTPPGTAEALRSAAKPANLGS